MNNRKVKMYVGIVLLILIVCGIGYLVYVNIGGRGDDLYELTPEAELPDDELRRTVVNLYFLDIATGEVLQELRTIDSRELVHNPYERLIELLLGGPIDESRTAIIPENTILNSAELKGSIVHIDFSEDFVNEQNLGEEQEMRIIRSIVNTLTELIEVDGIKINVDGNESAGFPDGYVTFETPFVRGM